MSAAKVDPQAFQKVVQASELLATNLKSCSSECHVYPTSVIPANTHLDISTNLDWSTQDGFLICILETGVQGKATKASGDIKENQLLFDVKVAVSVVYRLNEKELEISALEMFATQNGLFNGYPFVRETFVSLTTRMGLPPVILPLLKPGARVDAAAERKIESPPKAQ